MAALPQTIFKKTTQSAKSAAVSAAKAASREANETLKIAKDQIGVPQSEKQTTEKAEVPSIVNEIREKGVSDIDVAAIHARERSMLSTLEAELKAVQQKNKQQIEFYNERVKEDMQKLVSVSPVEAPVAQSKVRKAMGKVKKAVSTIMNRKQGETKQGSGKG